MIPLFKVFMAPDVDEHVGPVLQSGYIGQGQAVEDFETEFGKLVEAEVRPLSLNSCTSAIDLALHLIGVGPGDTVVSTPITCTATNTMVVNRGAKIIWADVDPYTGLIDPEDVAKKVKKNTKAIIAVDWAGVPCDYDSLKALGLPVIEDAAHGILTRYNKQSIAKSGGDYVCYSFQAIKTLTTGDGGILLTPPEQYDRAKLLRWYGLDRESSQDFRCSQNIKECGYKYHMNNIAAAIGLANLPHIRALIMKHMTNAAVYSGNLKNHPVVKVPAFDPNFSYWIYTIHTPRRDEFIQYMAENEISCSLVHARNDKHDAFLAATEDMTELPGVSSFDSTQVSIPVGWWLTSQDMKKILGAINQWV